MISKKKLIITSATLIIRINFWFKNKIKTIKQFLSIFVIYFSMERTVFRNYLATNTRFFNI